MHSVDPSCDSGSETDNVQILKGMFPTTVKTTLEQALASTGNDINMAVGIIVGDSDDDLLMHSVFPAGNC